MNSFIMKGDICYSETSDTLRLCEDAYLICENGRSMGVFTQIPEKYQHFEVLDYTGHMIVPGLSDLHVHAPQYAYRGLGMDMELLEWLETYAFPEESGYKDDHDRRHITDSEPEYDKRQECYRCDRTDDLKDRVDKLKYFRKASEDQSQQDRRYGCKYIAGRKT